MVISITTDPLGPRLACSTCPQGSLSHGTHTHTHTHTHTQPAIMYQRALQRADQVVQPSAGRSAGALHEQGVRLPQPTQKLPPPAQMYKPSLLSCCRAMKHGLPGLKGPKNPRQVCLRLCRFGLPERCSNCHQAISIGLPMDSTMPAESSSMHQVYLLSHFTSNMTFLLEAMMQSRLVRAAMHPRSAIFNNRGSACISDTR